MVVSLRPFKSMFGYLLPFLFSVSAEAINIPTPQITLRQVTDDFIISEEPSHEGWSIKGIEQIRNFLINNRGAAMNRRLSGLNEKFFPLLRLTQKPVLINLASQEHFAQLSADIPRDGSHMGIVYLFLPNQTLGFQDEPGSTAQIFIHLIRGVPNHLDGDEFELPDQTLIHESMTRYSHGLESMYAYTESKLRRDPLPVQLGLLRDAAENGNPQAEFEYAIDLDRKQESPQNLVLAKEFFRRSADQGHPVAQLAYALMLFRGRGGDVDLVQAREYFRRSADQEDSWGQFRYALMMLQGVGGVEDLTQAREFFRRSAEQRNSAAEQRYGSMLWQGLGGPVNLPLAREYLRRSAEQGDIAGEVCFALLLKEAGGNDLALARRYFQRAADRGNATARYEYGLMLWYGQGGAAEPIRARDYIRRAADQGDTDAVLFYAALLFGGKGGPADPARSRELYHQLADRQDHPLGQYWYGFMLFEGIGGSKNEEEGLNYLRESAAQGYSKALDLYRTKLKENTAHSRAHLRRIADLGDDEAKFAYASMLEQGLGGPEDLVQAREYFRQASDLGNARASSKYAWMLSLGRGGDKDDVAAYEYFKRAADQGDAEARVEVAFRQSSPLEQKDLVVAGEHFRRRFGPPPKNNSVQETLEPVLKRRKAPY